MPHVMAHAIMIVLCLFFSFVFGVSLSRALTEPALPWIIMSIATFIGAVATFVLECSDE